MFRSVSIIVNPVSGRSKAIGPIFESQFKHSNCEWEIDQTKKRGDAFSLAKSAVEGKRDCVCVYGGDGTVREVATALHQSGTTLAIFPGGTGNVLANELRLAANVKKNCRALLSGDYALRLIDVGLCNDQIFVARVSAGYEAELVRSAVRKLKTQAGLLAYAFGGLQAILRTRPTRYHIECEGKKEEYDGLSCVVANTTNLGIPGVNFWPLSRIDDGWLDFFIIRKVDTERLLKIDHRKMEQELIKEFFIHKRVKAISIRTEPPQKTHRDGEIIAGKELKIAVVPKALKVVLFR